MNSLIAHKHKKTQIPIELHVFRPKATKIAVKIFGLPDSIDIKKFRKSLCKLTRSSVTVKKDKLSDRKYVFAMNNCVEQITQILNTYGINKESIDVVGQHIK